MSARSAGDGEAHGRRQQNPASFLAPVYVAPSSTPPRSTEARLPSSPPHPFAAASPVAPPCFPSASPPPPAWPAPSPQSSATTQRLCVLAAGVLVFHVLTSALQEQVFHLPGFSNVLLLSFGETLCTTLLVALQLLWAWRERSAKEKAAASSGIAATDAAAPSTAHLPSHGQRWHTIRRIFHPSTVELHWYVRIAILMSSSLYLTNSTSYLLTYSLQVIFKSSKLLCMVLVRRRWMAGTQQRASQEHTQPAQQTLACSEVDNAELVTAAAEDVANHHHRTALSPTSTIASNGSASTAPFHYTPTSRKGSVLLSGSDSPAPPQRGDAFTGGSGGAHRAVCPSPPPAATAGAATVSVLVPPPSPPTTSCAAQRAEPRRFPGVTRQRLISAWKERRAQVTEAWTSLCSRRGAAAVVHTLVVRLRRLVQDTEMLACIAIVLGLICFTYASQLDKQAADAGAPAPIVGRGGGGDVGEWDMIAVGGPHLAAGLPSVTAPAVAALAQDAGQQQLEQTSFAPSAAAAGSFVDLLSTVWSSLSELSTLWLVTLVGVAGVLLSNFIDAVIYVLEEVHCFQTAPAAAVPSSPPLQTRVPASSQEVLFMLNGLATLLYGGSAVVSALFDRVRAFTSTAAPAGTDVSTTAAPAFPYYTFILLIILAAVTSLIGTLCLLAIVAEFTGVMAVVVTSMRKTLTVLLSFVLYRRRFTLLHALGLAGVMGGVVWYELLRRRRRVMKT